MSPISRRVLAFLVILALLHAVAPALPATAQDQPTAQQIEELLTQLGGEDLLARERAAERLAELRPVSAVSRVRQIFLTSDTPRPAAQVLAAIGTPRAMTTLVTALADADLTPRRNGAQVALLGLGDDAVDALFSALSSPFATVRQHAAELLGFLGSPQPVNALLRVAREDEVPQVRLAAVWAVGELDAMRARNTLHAISRTDPDPEVRREARRAALRVGEIF